MNCELRGGPKDGEVIDVDASFIFSRGEFYIPDKTVEPIVIATYRWVFGVPDHLDFIGYERTEVPPTL